MNNLCLCGWGKKIKENSRRKGKGYLRGHYSKRMYELGILDNKGINNPMYGRHQTIEAKKKIGLVHKGKKPSPLTEKGRDRIKKALIGNKFMLGKHQTEEAKRKSSINNIGKHFRKMPLGFSEKISKCTKGKNNPMYGKRHKEESKIKIMNKRLEGIENGTYHSGGRCGWYFDRKNQKYFYRSSYELAFMKYLDNLNLNWIFEGDKNIFFLKSIGRYYINDFFVEEWNKYIQIKGRKYPDKIDKFEIFKKENPNLKAEEWNKEKLVELGIL